MIHTAYEHKIADFSRHPCNSCTKIRNKEITRMTIESVLLKMSIIQGKSKVRLQQLSDFDKCPILSKIEESVI